MSHKSIFQASFEESLNLEDNGFRQLHQEQHDKTVKYVRNGKFLLWFSIRSLIYTLIFPLGGNFFFLVAVESLYDRNGSELSFRISPHRILTADVFLLLALIWFTLVLLGRVFKQNFILPYRYQFHVFTTMVWVVIEFNLLFITMFEPSLSAWGILAILLFLLLLAYLMFNNNLNYLREELYGEVTHISLSSSIISYALGVISLGLLIKIIVFGLSIHFSTVAKLFGLFAVWIFFDIAVIATVIYIGTPYFLQAYYKLKYPEDYRLWEGKTLEEWYGKKYLKKHSELLDKE